MGRPLPYVLPAALHDPHASRNCGEERFDGARNIEQGGDAP
jgi:hypothetical protein